MATAYRGESADGRGWMLAGAAALSWGGYWLVEAWGRSNLSIGHDYLALLAGLGCVVVGVRQRLHLRRFLRFVPDRADLSAEAALEQLASPCAEARRNAVDALAVVGTPRHLENLRAERRQGDYSYRCHVRAAIEAIEARRDPVGGATDGGLSLPDGSPSEGWVSLPARPTGELTVCESA